MGENLRELLGGEAPAPMFVECSGCRARMHRFLVEAHVCPPPETAERRAERIRRQEREEDARLALRLAETRRQPAPTVVVNQPVDMAMGLALGVVLGSCT